MENRRLNTAIKMSVRQRNYQRARGRALVKLAKAHREEYRLYFEQEKLNDHTQGKTWLDIDGNTSLGMDANARADTSRSETETTQTSNQSRAGNL
jgi:hypothetical protein